MVDMRFVHGRQFLVNSPEMKDKNCVFGIAKAP
jgi:hypothetical protein